MDNISEKLNTTVVSNNIQNEYDRHIIVAPLSDEDWENLAKIRIFEVLVKANSTNGLDKDRKILFDRIRVIDKKFRLRDYCGVVDKEIIEKVDKGLEVVLNIKKIL